MRRAVRVDSAHLFTRISTARLPETGRADAAVNEALATALSRGAAGDRLEQPGALFAPQRRQALAASDGKRRRRLPSGGRCCVSPPVASSVLCRGCRRSWRSGSSGSTSGQPEMPRCASTLQVSQLFFRLAESATVLERLQLEEVATAQLASVRLPAEAGHRRNERLPSRHARRRLARHAPDATSGPGRRCGDRASGGEHLSHRTRGFEPGAARDLSRRRHAAPHGSLPIPLHRDHPDALVLQPRSSAVDVDVTFAQFATDSFTNDIRINALNLIRVTDEQSAVTTSLRKESTLLSGRCVREGDWPADQSVGGRGAALRDPRGIAHRSAPRQGGHPPRIPGAGLEAGARSTRASPRESDCPRCSTFSSHGRSNSRSRRPSALWRPAVLFLTGVSVRRAPAVSHLIERRLYVSEASPAASFSDSSPPPFRPRRKETKDSTRWACCSPTTTSRTAATLSTQRPTLSSPRAASRWSSASNSMPSSPKKICRNSSAEK